MARGKAISLHTFGRWGAAIVLLIAFGTSLIFGQGATATISGSVYDSSGAVVPGVRITVKHTESGLTRNVVSSERGNYNVPLLPVGAYELSTVMPGFKQAVRSGINLVVGQEAVVDLTLEVGANAEQITVTEEAPLVAATTSSTSGLISEQAIKDLPLNGRSFDQLLTINVGVSNSSTNTLNNGWTAFSVAGKRPETNRFVINGIDYIGGNAPGLFITPSGAGGQLLGVDAVREYNVLQHTYGAEYGKRAGGQIAVVTSSGTNNWHGSAFEFLRNSALDARNFFDQTTSTPPFKRNQFGGTVGGPIKKDKMFIFGNYEGFQQRLALSQLAIVPDNCARRGLMSTASAAVCGGPVPNLKAGMLPFVNAFWPAPNGDEFLVNGQGSGAAQYFSNAPQAVRENFFMARFDYVASSKDTFFVNYTNDHGRRDVSQIDPNFVQVSNLHPQTFGLQETHIFSPKVLNSFTAGVSRSWSTLVTNPAVSIPSNLIFLTGGNPGSIIIGGGATTVVASAYTPANGSNQAIGARNHFTYADDLHITKGRHSWSMGAWVQRVQQNQAGAAQASAGNVAYPTVLAMLQDQPSQFIINRAPLGVGYRTTEGAWYLQDEMKLRSNLTVRLGLRHEMTNGWHEVAGRCANYRWDNNFVISTETVLGDSCFDSNHAKLLLQPRVGLAWDPTGTGTWAVRAGFGIHNDLIDNLGIRLQPNPPTNAREQFTPTPTGGLQNGLLGLYPLQRGVALPPTCGTTAALGVANCSIYSPAGVDPNLRTPTIQQWSLTVQRELTRNMMLEVGYVGSESYHTNIAVNGNSASPLVCQNPQGCISGGTTQAGQPVPVSQQAVVPQGTLYMVPATRPNANVASGISWWGWGTSGYHALNVSVVKRATRGLTFKTNYSWGKVMDYNSAVLAPAGENEPAALITSYIRSLNRGIAAFSLAHQFNGSYSYQLPFGNGQRFAGGSTGLANQLVGGWQWNGIFSWQGGFPFTPLVGSNPSGTGDASQSDVPNWNPNFKGPVVLGRPDQWFDPRAFLMPTPGTFGNLARGSLRGPGLTTFDTSLFKKFTVTETLTLQFRAEAFNLFNHANFSYPNEIVFNGSAYSPSAGVITQTNGTSRQLQFALKLIF
jgi:hypothetical protein